MCASTAAVRQAGDHLPAWRGRYGKKSCCPDPPGPAFAENALAAHPGHLEAFVTAGGRRRPIAVQFSPPRADGRPLTSWPIVSAIAGYRAPKRYLKWADARRRNGSRLVAELPAALHCTRHAQTKTPRIRLTAVIKRPGRPLLPWHLPLANRPDFHHRGGFVLRACRPTPIKSFMKLSDDHPQTAVRRPLAGKRIALLAHRPQSPASWCIARRSRHCPTSAVRLRPTARPAATNRTTWSESPTSSTAAWHTGVQLYGTVRRHRFNDGQLPRRAAGPTCRITELPHPSSPRGMCSKPRRNITRQYGCSTAPTPPGQRRSRLSLRGLETSSAPDRCRYATR